MSVPREAALSQSEQRPKGVLAVTLFVGLLDLSVQEPDRTRPGLAAKREHASRTELLEVAEEICHSIWRDLSGEHRFRNHDAFP